MLQEDEGKIRISALTSFAYYDLLLPSQKEMQLKADQLATTGQTIEGPHFMIFPLLPHHRKETKPFTASYFINFYVETLFHRTIKSSLTQ